MRTRTGAPGTLFYSSGPFPIETAGGNYVKALSLLVTVPDTFTWIIEFFPPAGSVNLARLLLYNPPTVGSSDPEFYWQHWGPAGWSKGTTPAPPRANLMAKMTAGDEILFKDSFEGAASQ